MFEGIGLTEDEESFYCSLLSQSALPRAELAGLLPGWTPERTATVVETLLEKGLIMVLAGPPARYRAITPDVAIEALCQQRISSVQRAQQVIPDLMKQFWIGRQREVAADFVEILAGSRDAIVQRVWQIQQAVERSVRGLDRPPYASDPAEFNPGEEERLARGVSYQVIYDQVVVETPERWPAIERGLALGEQARVLPGLPIKLTLFDDLAATLPIVSASGDVTGAIVVHRSPLLDGLSALFDAYWAQAVPLTPDWPGQDRPPADGADARSRADRLVTLLSAGMTDEAIRRTLGVSSSTVQRSVSDLLRRLGARTRFQAGLQIGRGHARRGRASQD